MMPVFHNFPPPSNKHKHWSSKGEHILLSAFGLYCLHYSLDPATELTIKLDGRLHCYYGQCEKINRKSFIITMARDMEEDEPEQTLWHELTHLWQYQRGALKDVGYKWAVYKGKRFRNMEIDDPHYYKQPWEAQAQLISGRLWGMYKENCLTVRGARV
jgi:hypothetical protein